MSGAIYVGDALDELRTMEDGEVQCCITSPPYFGLRNYGVEGQIGLETNIEDYVTRLVEMFREARRVLRDDGVLFLNLGDSYAANRSYQVPSTKGGTKHGPAQASGGRASRVPSGLKQKDLIGIPWRVAFALQADGWYLRNDIIWAKPNPMPSSATDRFTVSHEHVFLLTKKPRYYFDQKAVMEPSVTGDTRRPYGSKGAWELDGRPTEQQHGGKPRKQDEAGNRTYEGFNERWKSRAGKNAFRGQGAERDSPTGAASREGRDLDAIGTPGLRNKRDVWTIAPRPFKGSHFATFPPKLIEPMVLAGCPKGGTVLDPFFGAGTTGLVAESLDRNWVGIELNPTYVTMAADRIKAAHPGCKIGIA